jgi:hypothetical protein
LKIEWVEECSSCKGTGVYVGCLERDGYGVVCSDCKGTGKIYQSYIYNEFTERKRRDKIHTILESNAHICVGIGKDKEGNQLEFGGIPYPLWEQGFGFPIGSEMRNYTCPRQWVQMINNGSKRFSKVFDWDCNAYRGFDNCKEWKNKSDCWRNFDVLYKGRK